MKKSARQWFVMFLMSLVPLTYVTGEYFQLPLVWEPVLGLVSLGAGLLCTIPIWTSAVRKLRTSDNRQEVLSIVALLVCYGYGFISNDKAFLWQPVALTSALIFGGWISQLQVSRALNATSRLEVELPDKTTLVDGRELKHIGTDELGIGDVILVRPGSLIPADGFVIQGSSLVSQTAVTREVEPLHKEPGDWVLAGSENLPGKGAQNGALTIRVSALGRELIAHELQDSLALENEPPARFTKFGKVASSTLSLITIAAALTAAGFYLVIGGNIELAVIVATSILVAAQVSAIATAVPLTSTVSSIRAALYGVLVRSRNSFELLSHVNHIVFNKTGVLTVGHTSVGKIHLARNTSIGSESELLALAAAVEMGTSHELGHLIIQEAAKRGLELPTVTEFAPLPGLGVSALFDGSLVQVGNAGMVNVSGVNMNPYDLFQVSNAYQEGSSVVFVSIDDLLVGYIEFQDKVRANSQQAIIELSGRHAITVLSGDATNLVEKITHDLGLKDFAAEVLSTRKADWIKERKASGSRVLYIADGHYDAAALAEADVAIAFGAGPNAHSASAEIIQISQDPLVIARLVKLAKRTKRISLTNILVALFGSLALIAISVIGIFPPVVALAGILMSWLLKARSIWLLR